MATSPKRTLLKTLRLHHRPNSVGETSLTKESAEAKRKEAADRERFKEEARKRKEEKGGAVDADDGGMELGYVNDLNRCVFARPPRQSVSINGRPGSIGQKFVHSCVCAHDSVTSLLNLS